MTTPAAPAVRLEHVVKAFSGRRVLDDVTLDVARGTCCCVLGRSGTGKSVMLKHIIGLLAPDAGRVFVEDQELSGLGPQEMSRVRLRIGFLFQHAALFDSISVGENVAFPLRRHTVWPDAEIRRRALKKLTAVGLGADVGKMPSALSGGMRKRAGLARAMALDPAILLVDEPSAGLDPVTAMEIDALLERLKREAGTTLIVVTHNISSARMLGDDLVFLHEGRILQQGTVAAFDKSKHPLVQTFMAAGSSTG
ncbi:MAG: ABC transporter ATP-binding protein [Vicinamibacterales bacterium]